jgi:DNA-binding response OmpR family regulator
MQPTQTILLCEEDAAVRVFLAENLTADGYHVLAVDDRTSALEQLERAQPDLVVCDVNGETLDLLDAVRHADGVASRIDPDVPLIVLTARADELARVRFLERGGDDVIRKPFSYGELRGRIRALLRRSHARQRGPVTRVGALCIDHAARQVSVRDTPIAVSAKEYALLAHLAAEPTRVFTRKELLRDVWGYRTPSRTVDSHACRVRHKLAAAGERDLVQTVWGIGYRLCSPVGQRPFKDAA